MKKDRKINLVFNPKTPVSRASLLNLLASSARVVHGDPELGILEIQIIKNKKPETVARIKII